MCRQDLTRCALFSTLLFVPGFVGCQPFGDSSATATKIDELAKSVKKLSEDMITRHDLDEAAKNWAAKKEVVDLGARVEAAESRISASELAQVASVTPAMTASPTSTASSTSAIPPVPAIHSTGTGANSLGEPMADATHHEEHRLAKIEQDVRLAKIEQDVQGLDARIYEQAILQKELAKYFREGTPASRLTQVEQDVRGLQGRTAEQDELTKAKLKGLDDRVDHQDKLQREMAKSMRVGFGPEVLQAIGPLDGVAEKVQREGHLIIHNQMSSYQLVVVNGTYPIWVAPNPNQPWDQPVPVGTATTQIAGEAPISWFIGPQNYTQHIIIAPAGRNPLRGYQAISGYSQ
jgi:hypothetical protein